MLHPCQKNEEERLRSIDEYGLIEMLPEETYNDIVKIAAEITDADNALINIVGKDYQYTKAQFGNGVEINPRQYCFCAHAILKPDEVMIVPDARQDERFYDNPNTLVEESPSIFYAGVPLKDSRGNAMGTLCVTDSHPRELSPVKIDALVSLAQLVQSHFEIRKLVIDLKHKREELDSARLLSIKLDHSFDRLSSFVSEDGAGELKNARQTVESLKAILKD